MAAMSVKKKLHTNFEELKGWFMSMDYELVKDGKMYCVYKDSKLKCSNKDLAAVYEYYCKVRNG